jgi:glycosyltransferase involved in cell wall biosynthesis
VRIVHVLKHAVRGNGSVHVAVDLACAQADAGHDVWFASARGSYDDLLRAHGVSVTPIPEPTSVREATRSMFALLRLVRREKIEVIHGHMMSSAVIGRVVAQLSGARLVTTMHNSFDGHSWLMRLGAVTAAVSEAERTLLLSRGFSDRRLVTVINGVGGSAREELPIDDIGELQQPSIMTLCGLHHRKGVNDVISAFALISDEYPAWHLNVVGWGAAQAELQQQAEDLGLAERVHFLGSTLTPWPLLASTRIFATGSLADPCPLTVMEARVAGRAIVGTRVGGIPEVLEDGQAGHLVPPQDPEAMAVAFRELVADPATLLRWQELAEDPAGFFTVRRMADDYDLVYQWLLGLVPKPTGTGVVRSRV